MGSLRRSAVLRLQIERASLSIVLNIAEGAGRRTVADKQRFFPPLRQYSAPPPKPPARADRAHTTRRRAWPRESNNEVVREAHVSRTGAGGRGGGRRRRACRRGG
ncbi:MAG: four helix bundle protein [Candidatus Binatia bacterium]